MASRLYVGGLPYATTDDELRQMFEASGTVASATVATDKGTGRSKGFGFVEMSTEDEAKSAIEAVHGKTMGERTIRVEVAQVPKRD